MPHDVRNKTNGTDEQKNTRIDLLFKEQNVPLYDFSCVSIELIVFDGISMKKWLSEFATTKKFQKSQCVVFVLAEVTLKCIADKSSKSEKSENNFNSNKK